VRRCYVAFSVAGKGLNMLTAQPHQDPVNLRVNSWYRPLTVSRSEPYMGFHLPVLVGPF